MKENTSLLILLPSSLPNLLIFVSYIISFTFSRFITLTVCSLGIILIVVCQ